MKPINYSNTVMYKIVPKDLNSDLIYVGHTTNFRGRKSSHKSDCENIQSSRYNFQVYVMIRANGGWDAWEMIEIEKYPCNDGNEARTRERQLMEEFNANLNMILPICSIEEWKEKNKDDILSKAKEYREKNKDVINAKAKEWYEKNKDAKNAKAKEYHEKNKDAKNAKARERYQKNPNREIINAKDRERYQKKKALELENK